MRQEDGDVNRVNENESAVKNNANSKLLFERNAKY